jgi:hypothetical protein
MNIDTAVNIADARAPTRHKLPKILFESGAEDAIGHPARPTVLPRVQQPVGDRFVARHVPIPTSNRLYVSAKFRLDRSRDLIWHNC